MMNVGSPMGHESGSSSSVESVSTTITIALALVLVMCGLLTAISPIAIYCILPGLTQLVAAVIFLIMEALSCCGRFRGKPYWLKACIYGLATLVPFMIGISMGCFGPAFIIGFLASLGITAVFGLSVLRRNDTRDEKRLEAGGTQTGAQPFSPTSP